MLCQFAKNYCMLYTAVCYEITYWNNISEIDCVNMHVQLHSLYQWFGICVLYCGHVYSSKSYPSVNKTRKDEAHLHMSTFDRI